MDYVFNAWYVAGWSSEFDQQLCTREMLEQHLVMFRNSKGLVVALEDRCPHRQLPLSHGKLIGDDIQCGYHGLTFDCSGRCVRIPGADNIPKTAYVESYPVEEAHGIVWVWMGDAQLADAKDVFSLPQWDDPKWYTHLGEALHLKANYLNVAENLVDPAHISFVHPTTLGSEASEDIGVNFETDGEVITAWRWIKDAPPIGFFREVGNFSSNVDRWHYYDLHLPCTAVIDFGSSPVEKNLQPADRDQGVRVFALHFLTPVRAGYTIDRWVHVRNISIDDEAVSARMDELFKIAFAEDKAILEAIEEAEHRPQKRRPIRIGIDRGPIIFRRRIQALIDTEMNNN